MSVTAVALSSVLVLLAHNVAADATEAPAKDSAQSVLPLVERVLYSMPVGEDSTHCIRLPERECCSDPDAGLGAVASNGDIWWYDLGNRNIKIFSGSGTRVVPGFSGVGTPADMAVNGAAVYLLFDHALDPGRFRIWMRVHADTTWRGVPFFYGPGGLPPDSVPVTVRNSSGGDVGQLHAGADEMLYFYQRLAHESYPVAHGDSIFCVADQARLGFEGFRGPNGRKYLSYGGPLYITDSSGEEELTIMGQLVGVDGLGRTYFECFERGGPTLEVRSAERLLAATPRTTRENWGRSGAKGSLQVRPDGGLIEFQPTAERLIISLWEPSPD